MSSYYTNPPSKIYNDRITLYRTNDINPNGNWFYRFVNPLTRKGYIRKSSKSKDYGEASSIAIAHYNELDMRSRLGVTRETTTIRDLLTAFGDEVTKSVSEHWELCYRAYWKEYWGARDLFYVSDDDIKQYIQWRTSSKNIKHTRYGMDREHGNWVDMEERTVGIGTLRKDIRGIKYLLKRAFDKRMIANYPHFARLRKNMNNVVDLPDQQKRARLTEEQALTIKSWRQSFRNKWKNVIEAERNDRDISVPHPFHHPKWRYNAVMFYVGISLTLTTGIRPMEIRLIRWKDIGDIFVDGDKKYSIIKIRREVSKVGKFRDTIANDFDRTAIRLQDWKYEWSKRFNREPTKEDYVFPTDMDSTKQKNHCLHIIRNHM
jgi:integrase